MPFRDMVNTLHIPSAAVITEAGNTALVSAIIDTAGYNSLTFVIGAGTLADADATFTVLVEDGDAANLSDAAAVADGFLIGTEALAGFTFAEDQKARKIGYKGPKRYVRCTVTPANNASGAPLAILPILGHPRNRPTANPPS